jgi:tetratricopeptide (TPR) repeat protein
MLGQFDKAISDFTEVIRLQPNEFAAYTSRGNCYARLEQYQKAISDYTKAVRGPGPVFRARAYCDRGYAYLEVEEFEKAISDYTEAIRLAPNFSDFYDGRAIAFDKLGKSSEAAQDRKKAKELKGGPRR